VASLRWRKLRGDLGAARGRVVLMIVALAVSLTGFGTVLGARTVLQREIAASYLASRPADATLELPGGVDAAVLAAVRARPDIAAASARDAILARVAVDPAASLREAMHGLHAGDTHGDAAPGGDAHPGDAHPGKAHGGAAPGGDPHGGVHGAWSHGGGHGEPPPAGETQPLLVFVEDDFAGEIHALRRVSGAWPPPDGAMLVERTAVGLIGAGEGDSVTITTPHGTPQRIAIAGIVHDTAVAPAWQEHRGYAYLTRATLAQLGEPAVLHDLGVRFQPSPATQAEAEAAASTLARWLTDHGHPVGHVRVPTLRRHPHDAQMRTVQLALLVFSGLLLLLSSILIATLLSALLARQTREIGVMKAIGARTAQLAVLYAALILVIAGIALALAVPLGRYGAQGFIAAVATMLNLAVDDPAIPWQVFAVQAAAGLAVPLAIAAFPILSACRRTVRAALADHGARELVRAVPRWLPHAARNALRTPVRLALATSLLVAGGVTAMTAFNLKRAYDRNLERIPEMWHYDVDFWLADPAPATLATTLAAVPGVRVVEPWSYAAASRPRPDGVDLLHTYPDQGHGAFRLYGAPPDTQLATLPLVSGRWLVPGDTDAIVLTRADRAAPGDHVTLAIDGRATRWTVVGVVDPLPLGGAFVSADSFARATGQGPRLFRVAFSPGAAPSAVTTAVATALKSRGATVETIAPFRMFAAAIDDHVLILTRAAIALAAIMALVGLLGLAAAMGISVLERTREIGVLKAIGAPDRRVFRLIVGEALAIGLASWLLATALAIPATYALDRLLAAQGFISPVFVIAPSGILAWLLAVLAGSTAASFLPARRAARLTVRAALAET